MKAIFETWVIPFVSILFVVDPLAAIPAFLSMTVDDPPEKRHRMALKASLAAGLILALFATAGGMVFRLFGITLPAFRIAGGVILGLAALEMLRADMRIRGTREEIKEGEEKADVTITPLAMPLLAGPGAISTVTVLMHGATTWNAGLPIYVAIAGTSFITYLLLRLSDRLLKLLGRTGINVLGRIMGLLLAALAAQLILDGIRGAGLIRE